MGRLHHPGTDSACHRYANAGGNLRVRGQWWRGLESAWCALWPGCSWLGCQERHHLVSHFLVDTHSDRAGLPDLSAAFQASAPDGDALQRLLPELQTEGCIASNGEYRGARGLWRL